MKNIKICSISFSRSRLEVFCKKGVLKNFAEFTGKHLYQRLFFNKPKYSTLSTISSKTLSNISRKSIKSISYKRTRSHSFQSIFSQYRQIEFFQKYTPNKKYNCNGPLAFKSQRVAYQSNQKLLHHCQHSNNQLNSYSHF